MIGNKVLNAVSNKVRDKMNYWTERYNLFQGHNYNFIIQIRSDKYQNLDSK